MPIYNPADYPAIIARLKAKLAEKGVVMGSTLSEADITAFETACNTRLPEAYRLFLQQVGDGCQDIRRPGGIVIYGLKRLADTEVKDLSRSVTIDDYWLWEEEEMRHCSRTKHLRSGWVTKVCCSSTKAVAIPTSLLPLANGLVKCGTSAT